MLFWCGCHDLSKHRNVFAPQARGLGEPKLVLGVMSCAGGISSAHLLRTPLRWSSWLPRCWQNIDGRRGAIAPWRALRLLQHRSRDAAHGGGSESKEEAAVL